MNRGKYIDYAREYAEEFAAGGYDPEPEEPAMDETERRARVAQKAALLGMTVEELETLLNSPESMHIGPYSFNQDKD